ncbi:MAG: hypothetical protein WBX25_11535 [Rhodomicrobium sp.]
MFFRAARFLIVFAVAFSLAVGGAFVHETSAHATEMGMAGMVHSHDGNSIHKHPCCPEKSSEKSGCTAACCAGVLPLMAHVAIPFEYVAQKLVFKTATVLSDSFSDPPSRPPQA